MDILADIRIQGTTSVTEEDGVKCAWLYSFRSIYIDYTASYREESSQSNVVSSVLIECAPVFFYEAEL